MHSVGVVTQVTEDRGLYAFDCMGILVGMEWVCPTQSADSTYLDSNDIHISFLEPCCGPDCAEDIRILEEAPVHISCQTKIVYVSFLSLPHQHQNPGRHH